MEDAIDRELRYYKFFCFHGEPKAMYIASGRSINQTRFDFYNMNFHHLNIIQKYPNSEVIQRKPTTFDEMIRIAKTLSKA